MKIETSNPEERKNEMNMNTCDLIKGDVIKLNRDHCTKAKRYMGNHIAHSQYLAKGGKFVVFWAAASKVSRNGKRTQRIGVCKEGTPVKEFITVTDESVDLI